MLYKQGTPKSVIDAAIAKENLAMAKSNKGDFVASNSIDDPSAKAEPAKGREKAAAYDLEKQEMAAKEAAMAAVAERKRTARPITGVAGPEMPTFGTPSISPAEKAKQAADLAAKIKANTPSPAPPSRTANRPFFQNQRPPIQPPMQPRPPVRDPKLIVDPAPPTPPRPVQLPRPPVQIPVSETGPGMLPPTPPRPIESTVNAPMKKGGKVKSSSYKSGGNVSTASSASRRGDGIAQRGKTKGRMC